MYRIKQYVCYTVPPRIYVKRQKFRKTSVIIIPTRAYIATLNLTIQKRQCYQPDREWVALSAQTRAHLHRHTHKYMYSCVYACM